MGDKNKTPTPEQQAFMQQLYEQGKMDDLDTYKRSLGLDVNELNSAASRAGNAVVDTASNVGKSLMNMFGGSSQPGEESKPLGKEISDNMQQVAKKMALKRLQNQSNSN